MHSTHTQQASVYRQGMGLHILDAECAQGLHTVGSVMLRGMFFQEPGAEHRRLGKH